MARLHQRTSFHSRVGVALCLAAAVCAAHAVEIPLARVDSGGDLLVPIPVESRETVFKAEPPYEGYGVLRSAIPTGPDESTWTPFAWDMPRRVLVDTNRNLDLTDDGAEYKGASQWQELYENVRVMVPVDGAEVAYTVNLALRDLPTREKFGVARVRSGWAGVGQFCGVEQQILVVDNLDGRLDENDMLYIGAPAPEMDDRLLTRVALRPEPQQLPNLRRIPFARRLHFPGESLALDLRFTPEGDAVLSVEPVDLPLGVLNVQGKYIKRLVLTGRTGDTTCTAVLENPDGDVRVPVADYRVHAVYLDGLDLMAWSDRELSVKAESTAALAIGGPLYNKMLVSREGSRFNFSPGTLQGAGGEIYQQIADFGPPMAPGDYAVYDDGKQVLAGRLEYG